MAYYIYVIYRTTIELTTGFLSKITGEKAVGWHTELKENNTINPNFTCSKYRGDRKTFLDKFTLRNV